MLHVSYFLQTGYSNTTRIFFLTVLKHDSFLIKIISWCQVLLQSFERYSGGENTIKGG